MIKKFEEFVNETVSPSWKNRSHSWRNTENNLCDSEELMDLFKSFDIDDNNCRALLRRFDRETCSIYSIEEVRKIFEIVFSIVENKDYAFSFAKYMFYKGESVEEKQNYLDDFSKKINGGIPLPIVMDINGKMITGEVYYCEALDAYAKDEDDFNKYGSEWLAKEAEKEGILDDDQPDWMDNHWDMLEIYAVNLDEEYLDKETNRWTKR